MFFNFLWKAIFCFILLAEFSSVTITASNNFSSSNYVFQSVRAGQNIILTNEKGEKIGILRVMTPESIICFDKDNKQIGIIYKRGNMAVLFDKAGKQLGVIEKLGNNYVLNKKLDSNPDNKQAIHVE